ncbi:MAG: tetratricopeptide repeat protein [Elusimicrobia bacterium]|nr:tetratricopeptide repeat protein [Elusimicrobiota bacterium]
MAVERPRLTRVAPFLVFAAAFLVFSGVLRNGFVAWDDPVYLLDNPHFRGFGWENLRWMATNTLQSVYQPLAWLTLALDHALWGMEPGGYHLQSLLWHGASAALFYFVALRLLVLARGGGEEENAPGALVAALLFAVHPLRTEAVAWASERRELVGDFFWLAAVLSYLRPGRPIARTAGFLLLALLAKGTMLSLPLVLLVLDWYPLRRLSSPRDLAARISEKRSLFALAGAFGVAGVLAARAGGELAASAAIWGPAQRLAQLGFGLAFYARKTLWPTGLCFLYRMPFALDPLEPRFVLSGLAASAVLAAAWLRRRRFPAGPAAAAAYSAALFPVLGFVKYGPHLAADRYSNLSCLPIAVLAGAGFVPAVRRWRAEMWGLLAAVVLALALLSARQAATWRDSVALWSQAAAAAPEDARFHANLGIAAAERGDRATAESELTLACRLDPASPALADGWAAYLAGRGRWEEAAAAYRSPAGRARAFARLGRAADAEREYRAALAAAPGDADARHGLGVLLLERGRLDEARTEFEAVLRADPARAEARVDLGLVLSRAGRRREAEEQFRRALYDADAATKALAHHDWGNALSDEGRLAAALPHYREAARLAPALAEASFNLGNTLARLGRYGEAAAAYRETIRRAPGHPDARRNLRAALSLSSGRQGRVPVPEPVPLMEEEESK